MPITCMIKLIDSLVIESYGIIRKTYKAVRIISAGFVTLISFDAYEVIIVIF